jgi:hypothetical protein
MILDEIERRSRDRPRHHLAGDDADGTLADAPGDADDGIVVEGVPVQHPGVEIETKYM